MMNCLWPTRKRSRVDSPPSAPTRPAEMAMPAVSEPSQPTHLPKRPHVPRLALERLGSPQSDLPTPCLAALASPIPVSVDGFACATERTLRSVLSTYQAHQASKDIAAQVERVRAEQGWVHLVVGGERAPFEYRSPRGLFAAETYEDAAHERAEMPTRAAEVTLNSDATALPHVWGDVASSATMMRFADASIDAVTFECVPYTAFTCLGDRTLESMFRSYRNDLRDGDTPWLWSAASPTEYRSVRVGADTFAHLARVLRPGAVLDLVTGFPPETPRRTMMQALATAGFTISRLETPWSPRMTRSWLLTHASDLQVQSIAKRKSQALVLRAKLEQAG